MAHLEFLFSLLRSLERGTAAIIWLYIDEIEESRESAADTIYKALCALVVSTP